MKPYVGGRFCVERWGAKRVKRNVHAFRDVGNVAEHLEDRAYVSMCAGECDWCSGAYDIERAWALREAA